MTREPSLSELEAEWDRRQRERAGASLAEFVKQSWCVLEPATPLVWNWHLDVMCEHLQALLEGRLGKRNLVINVPPGSMKSRIVSVCAPAWIWLHRPSWRSIFASANPRVSLRDSVFCRDLLESDWYQGFKPGWKLKADQNAKGLYSNSAGGSRLATSVGSKITGDRADALFVDDPLDAAEAHSQTFRDAANQWWDQAFANRLNDLSTGSRCIIMQRLHHEDLTGHVLEMEPDGWDHLCIPQEWDEESRIISALGWTDPRTIEGELMFPGRFPAEVLAVERRRLGSSGYAGQHQQRPQAKEGGVFKKDWLRYYRKRDLLTQWEAQTISVDATFKETGKSYVVVQVWGRSGPNHYLLHQAREHRDFVGTLEALRRVIEQWPKALAKLVEDKANGPALMSVLQREVEGVIPINPQGSKELRAYAVTPLYEAGNVFLPHPDETSWVSGLVDELLAFPNAANDDQVDALTQYLSWANGRGSGPGLSLGGMRRISAQTFAGFALP